MANCDVDSSNYAAMTPLTGESSFLLENLEKEPNEKTLALESVHSEDSTVVSETTLLDQFLDFVSSDEASISSFPATPNDPTDTDTGIPIEVGFEGLCPEYQIHDINKYGSMASFIRSRIEQGETGSFLVRHTD
jgi:hypothetical protein